MYPYRNNVVYLFIFNHHLGFLELLCVTIYLNLVVNQCDGICVGFAKQ